MRPVSQVIVRAMMHNGKYHCSDDDLEYRSHSKSITSLSVQLSCASKPNSVHDKYVHKLPKHQYFNKYLTRYETE